MKKQNIVCNALWKGFLDDSFQFTAVSIPAYCSFVLIASSNLTVAERSSTRLYISFQLDGGFVENLSESEARSKGLLAPAGLTNLINTCYANSVVQVLHNIPELKEGVLSYSLNNNAGGTPGALVQKLRDTFEELDKSTEAVRPFAFINVWMLGAIHGRKFVAAKCSDIANAACISSKTRRSSAPTC